MTNRLTGYQNAAPKVTLEYADGRQLLLDVYTNEIIRVFMNRGRATNSYAIEGDKHHKTSYTVEDKGDHIELRTPSLIVKAYDNCKVDFYDGDGNPLGLPGTAATTAQRPR